MGTQAQTAWNFEVDAGDAVADPIVFRTTVPQAKGAENDSVSWECVNMHTILHDSSVYVLANEITLASACTFRVDVTRQTYFTGPELRAFH